MPNMSKESAQDFTISDSDIDNGIADQPSNILATEKAVMEASAPLALHNTTASVAPEVTIAQVAPLVLVLAGATFLHVISAQAVVITLPSISRDLNIPETRQQWIVSAYALTSGAFLLLFGKLADVYGKRLMFILGCFWITATSLCSAFSPVEISIYIMRALAGLGGAVVIPTSIGIIGYTIPPGRVKNYSFAFYSGGAPLGQVFGNILGGIITEWANWKVVFYIIAGTAFLIGICAFFVIPKPPAREARPKEPRASSVDWFGAFLFTSGALLLLIALSEGVSQGWSTPFVIAILVVSILFLASFLFWQHHLERTGREPLMRVSTFRNARFACAMFITFMFSGGFTNFLVYSTYYYQNFQGLSPIQTSIRYIPLGICGLLAVLTSGYLLSLLRGDYILIFGLLSSIVANLLFALPIPPSTSYFAYGFPAMCLSAFGADTLYPCLGLFTTQSLPRKDQGVAGAMFQTMAGLGRAVFLPLTALVQASVQDKWANGVGGGADGNEGWEPYLEGLRAAEWLCVGLMVVCLVCTVIGLRNIGKIGLLKKLGHVQSGSKEKDEEKS